MSVLSAAIVEFVNILIEMVIIFVYLDKMFQRKYDSKAVYISAYLISSGILFAMVIISSQPGVLYGITALMLLLLSFLIYSEKPIVKIFFIIVYLLIILIADPILMGIMYILKLGSPQEFLESGMERIIGMAGTKILYIWMVFIITKVLKKKVRELPLKYWISIILMPIISIIILYSVFISMASAENRYNAVIYIVSISAMVYINGMMFNFFDSYSKQLKLSFMESVAEREAENYRALKIAYMEMKQLKHDLKNELSVICDMLDKQRYEKAEEHISELNTFIDKSAAVCYTGDEAVDSLINNKIKTAGYYNIRCIVKMKVYSEMLYNSVEMCRIIGNSLDNAIEACCRINKEDKFICISFKEVDDNILIEIANTSDYVDTENLSSSKQDKHLHGYGIQSIRSSSERIGGTLLFKYADDVFTMKLLLRKFLK